MRRWCLALHRYVGLAAAAFLTIAGVTGGLLVFGDNPGIRAMHVALMAGENGRRMVDAATAVALVLVPTGIWLWWRSKRLRLRFRAWDVHTVLGFYASALILLLVLTGAYLGFEQPITSALHMKSWTMPAAPRVRVPQRATRLAVDDLVARAGRALPGARIVRVDPPRGAASAIAFMMEGPGLFGRSAVYLDPYSGAVLRVDDFRRLPLAYRLHVIAQALHTGAFGGIGGKLAVLATSVLLVVVAVSGVMVWWPRGAAASARAGRRPRRVPARPPAHPRSPPA